MGPKDDSVESQRMRIEKASHILKNAQEDASRLLKNAQEDASRLLKNAQEDASRLLKNAQEDVVDNEYHKTPSQEILRKTERVPLKSDKLHTIGEMSSRLAHDLQNPLTIIKNTVEILKLKQANLDENTKEQYDKIGRAVSKMSQQINDVLNFVRANTPQTERISFLNLLNDVLSDLQIPEGVKVILPTEDTQLLGDVKQLEVVFSNLILNSIQAIDKNGKVMIQASDNEHMTTIDVIDNGCGISKENLDRLFEPLFTTKHAGTGLGLASCKAIVENHGGTIECSSIAGKGTVFTVHLPK